MYNTQYTLFYKNNMVSNMVKWMHSWKSDMHILRHEQIFKCFIFYVLSIHILSLTLCTTSQGVVKKPSDLVLGVYLEKISETLLKQLLWPWVDKTRENKQKRSTQTSLNPSANQFFIWVIHFEWENWPLLFDGHGSTRLINPENYSS